MNYNLIKTIENEDVDYSIFVSNKEYKKYCDDKEHKLFCSPYPYFNQIRKIKVSSDTNSVSV